MAFSFIKLFPATVLTTSAVSIYTCPASPVTSVVKNGRIRFTNTSAAAVAVTAYIVPSAGTASASNCFLNAYAIGANSYFDIDLPTMAAGDMLQALASAATSVTIHEDGGTLYS